MQDNPLYTCQDVAAMLGKSPITIGQVARKHSIGRKLGKTWIFTPADVDALRALPGPGKYVRKPKQI